MRTIRWLACNAVTAYLHVLFLFILQSCGVKGTNESQNFHIAREPPVPTFSSLSANVLQVRCISCHDEFRTEAGFFPLRVTAYERALNGSMPPGGPTLSADLVAQLKAYVDQQTIPTPAPVPAPVQPPEVIPLAPRYSSLQHHLFGPSCVRCHNANVHRAQIDLSTLESIRAESSLILEVLQEGTMPPEGESPIPSPETIAVFRQWVERGFEP